MKYDVTGIDSNGDEQTLETNVASEAEARRRAEGYGIAVTSIGKHGETAHAVSQPAAALDSGRRSKGKKGTILSLIFGFIFVGLQVARIAMRSSTPPTHRLTPGEMDFINEKLHPAMPDWAQDAKRNADASFAEMRRAQAARAATQPASQP